MSSSSEEPTPYTTAHQSLRKEVDRILTKKRRGETSAAIQAAHAEFYKQYPKFFAKLMGPELDMAQVQYIVGMFEKVQHKKTSYDDASKQIGQKMFDQYVKPDLPPPSETATPGISFSTPQNSGDKNK